MTMAKAFVSRWATVAMATAVLAAPITVLAVSGPPEGGSDLCRDPKGGIVQAAATEDGRVLHFETVGHWTPQRPVQHMTDASHTFLACASPGCRWPRPPYGGGTGGCRVLPENE